MNIGDVPSAELAAAKVLDRHGEERALGDYWSTDEPILLVFLRHYGCIGCSLNVTELAPRLPELHAMGLSTVFIGNGEKRHMDGFIERFRLDFQGLSLVTDPSGRVYEAAGFGRSFWGTAGPRALWGLVRNTGRGHYNGRFKGDWLRQGGSIILDGQGCVAHYRASVRLTDYTPAVELVDVVMRLLLAREPLPV